MDASVNERLKRIEAEMLTPDLPAYVSEYWHIFKNAYPDNPEVRLKVLQQLKKEGATLLDFYLAALFSRSNTLLYCFDCIKVMRERYGTQAIYEVPYEAWKVLQTAAVYSDAAGKLALHETSSGLKSSAQAEFCRDGDRVAYFQDIRLVGSLPLIGKCLSALVLISEKYPEEFHFIRKYVGQIVEWSRSGMRVEWIPPTFQMASDVFESSVTWCASCISHEAHHSMLYQRSLANHPGQSVPYTDYAGQKVEVQCMEAQARVLRALGAPSTELDYLSGLDGSHGE